MIILGTKVHNLTLPQALKRAEGFLDDGKQHYIVTPNPEIVLKARNDQEYSAILNRADLSIPDGIGLLVASRILYGARRALKTRITGVDFMQEFIGRVRFGATRSVLLLGGKNEVAKRAAACLQNRFPHMSFYALENPDNAHLDFVINEIIQPDCICVGLGAPRQERWINENLSKYPTVKIAMGVGGSFDFISGRISRAPFWIRAAGMEWFWRFTVQPWRIHRAFNAAIIFPLEVMKEKLKLSTVGKSLIVL
ncbi:MAG: WecB/TagA/CpsF family glycosyltransferase [Candidatus Spechtbacterales bacterium]